MAKKNEEKQEKQKKTEREWQEETRLIVGRLRMKGMEKWKQCKWLDEEDLERSNISGTVLYE